MILFCCAKRSISPSKAETLAKRSRSFYGRNSTSQKPQNQRLYTPFFSPWFFIKSVSLFCEGFPTGDLGGVFYEQKTGKGFYHIKELIL